MKSPYKTRAGFGVWRWVHIRICKACNREYKILGNDSRRRPSLPPGAIRCDCGANVTL
jgi:hypothetical protein